MKIINYFIVGFSTFFVALQCRSDEGWKSQKSYEISTRQTASEVGNGFIKRNNLNRITIDSAYLNQVSNLRLHARIPTPKEQEKTSALAFCACDLEAVLQESPNRTTYFFKPKSMRVFTNAMITIWYYKKDGASFASKNNPFLLNIKIGSVAGSYGLATAPNTHGGLLKLNLYDTSESPSASIVEISMRLNDLSDQNLEDASELLNVVASKIQLDLNRN